MCHLPSSSKCFSIQKIIFRHISICRTDRIQGFCFWGSRTVNIRRMSLHFCLLRSYLRVPAGERLCQLQWHREEDYFSNAMSISTLSKHLALECEWAAGLTALPPFQRSVGEMNGADILRGPPHSQINRFYQPKWNLFWLCFSFFQSQKHAVTET